jgi:hypothetical protein
MTESLSRARMPTPFPRQLRKRFAHRQCTPGALSTTASNPLHPRRTARRASDYSLRPKGLRASTASPR